MTTPSNTNPAPSTTSPVAPPAVIVQPANPAPVIVQPPVQALPVIPQLPVGQPAVQPAMAQAILPPTFSGSGEVDIEDWFSQFQRICNFNRWNDDQRNECLAMSLKAAAEEWWKLYVAQNAANVANLSFQAISDALRQSFRRTHGATYDVQQLLALRQGPQETVESFYWRMTNVCAKADPNTPEKIRKGFFITGLRPDIRQNVEFDTGLTFAALLEKAKVVEETNRNRPVLPTMTTAFTAALQMPPSSLEQQIQLLAQKYDNLLTLVAAQHQQPAPQPVVVSAMPQQHAPRWREKKQTKFRSDWTVDGRPVCRRCKKVGHTAWVCRAPAPVADADEQISTSAPLVQAPNPAPPPQAVHTALQQPSN